MFGPVIFYLGQVLLYFYIRWLETVAFVFAPIYIERTFSLHESVMENLTELFEGYCNKILERNI